MCVCKLKPPQKTHLISSRGLLHPRLASSRAGKTSWNQQDSYSQGMSLFGA